MLMEVHKDMYRQGTSKAGNPYCMQTAYLHFPTEPHPEKVEFFVPAPIPEGKYDLDLEKSMTVRNGQLQIGDLTFGQVVK